MMLQDINRHDLHPQLLNYAKALHQHYISQQF